MAIRALSGLIPNSFFSVSIQTLKLKHEFLDDYISHFSSRDKVSCLK